MNTWAKIILGDSRSLAEVDDAAVDLVVTSPPYWHLKDYGVPGQIGYGQRLHEYLQDLYRVWRECFRVLRPGGRLCINVGDQFARAAVYGRYRIIPLHAEIILQGERLGFDFLGSIIWQKKTTLNTTGGAPVMGSYPFPPNGLVEIDYEFILIFKKPGPGKRVSREVKEASRLTREEWKEWFAGHWHFGGARQGGHEAMFPEELPRRLIRMFTFVGDTVLDPFLGSGTTAKVALDLGRNAIGYEINDTFLPLIREKLGLGHRPPFGDRVSLLPRQEPPPLPDIDYAPVIPDALPEQGSLAADYRRQDLPTVAEIIDEDTLLLNDGRKVGFRGIKIKDKVSTIEYLRKMVLHRKVIIKNADFDSQQIKYLAEVYLKNKIFVNRFLMASGLAVPEADN